MRRPLYGGKPPKPARTSPKTDPGKKKRDGFEKRLRDAAFQTSTKKRNLTIARNRRRIDEGDGLGPDEVAVEEMAGPGVAPPRQKAFVGIGDDDDEEDGLGPDEVAVEEMAGPGPEANAELIAKLAFFDSIHDFWPERKTNAKHADDDEGEVLDISEEKMDIVHEKLTNAIARYLGEPEGTSIEQLLKNQTDSAIGAVSDIENKVLKYFSKTFAPFNEPTVSMKLTEIVKDWTFGNNWEDYQRRILALPDAIDIVKDKSVKSLSDAERGTVGFFLLAYLDPTAQPGTVEMGLTFDMSPQDTGKIFDRFKEVHNAIFPQNVADSASTSFSALQGRARYYKADGTPAAVGVTGGNKTVTSNRFSQGKYQIEFVDNGFSEKNRFGFGIGITNLETGEGILLPFGKNAITGKSAQQGPTVNYLMDILAAEKIEGVKPKLSTILTLDGLWYDEDLLFDLKRMGDWEQMLAVYDLPGIVGVSGDRLAAGYEQGIGKSGLRNTPASFRPFRSLKTLSDDQISDRKIKEELYRISCVVEKLKVICAWGPDATYPAILEDLNAMKEEVERGATFGTTLNKEPPSAPEQFANFFATAIVRLRMQDILAHITLIETGLKNPALAGGIADAAKWIAFFEAKPDMLVVEGEDITANGMNYSEKRRNAEAFLATLAVLEKMNVSLDVTGTPTKFFTQLFEPGTNTLIRGAKSSFFNFASAPYTHPTSGMVTTVARLLTCAAARRIESVEKSANETLDLYLKSRDLAKEAFFNKGLLDAVETATDITTGLSTAQFIGWQGTPVVAPQQGIQGAIAATLTLAGFTDKTNISPGPKVGGQVGGADGDVYQIRDIHDLFLEICDMAGQAVAERDNGMLDDIEAKWRLGIQELRETAEDDYKQAFKELRETNLITWFLSWRTTVAGPDSEFMFEADDPIVADLSTRGVRGMQVIYEFIRGKLLLANPVEADVLTVLSLFDTELKANPRLYEAWGAQGDMGQWSGIPVALQQHVQTVAPPPVGGADEGGGLRKRRSLYSNASEPHALPVRPPSDERLRERRRTRRAPRVRQSTRNSRRRGQRDDLDRV